MNPRPFKAYFFPGGGAGIWILAVLAKSSKFCGCLWFCLIHPTITRFKYCRVVRPFELVVVIVCGFCIGAGAAAGSGVGVDETVTESADDGGTAGAAGDGLLDLPHPAASAVIKRTDKNIVFGRQPVNRPKSKNGFIARVESG